MDDPWDVKCVRQSNHYVSCMKINGTPLLPPVLSKECRKEMQYYKLLAIEVEERLSRLKPLTNDDSDLSDDKTDAPELPESEQNYEIPADQLQLDLNLHTEKEINANNKSVNRSLTLSPNLNSLSSGTTEKITSNFTLETDTPLNKSSKLVIDLSLSINSPNTNLLEGTVKSPLQTPSLEIPEHDYNCAQKDVPVKVENKLNNNNTQPETDNMNKLLIQTKPLFKLESKETMLDPLCDYLNHDGPSSLSSKSFTGSLNDIHKDSSKNSQAHPLLRQRSYTVLTPSPLLLAHLKIQSMNTGVEISSISMSESLSSLSSPNKKRRSWDLESAKVKWSSMALELKKKNISGKAAGDKKLNGVRKSTIGKSPVTKTPQAVHVRSRSVFSEKPRCENVLIKSLTQSEPVHKPKKSPIPLQNTKHNYTPTNLELSSENSKVKSKSTSPETTLISESEDPAKRIRELYEKIQKQQHIQMVTLVEKQKKEQMLLQQVFEEQNNLLYTQLKTICPRSPVEVKEARGDVNDISNRGPVSLSQLISHKPFENSVDSSPLSSTLTDTNNYINQCDNILKKSRDITGGIKMKSQSENETKISSPKCYTNGTRTRTNSPNNRYVSENCSNNRNLNTSRKLTYETSASSERETEQPLTDRTNDTLADLNVTFPSDHSEDYHPLAHTNNVNHLCGKELVAAPQVAVPIRESPYRKTDGTIKNIEETIKHSVMEIRGRAIKRFNFPPPTAEERLAATKIVACAKGYLVRRLMRTERVQSTVQTIRDALLCALQLHQDREGIRGADVDLHRRLIQQITAACYSLHDTFIANTPAERCALIATDRSRRRSLALRPSPRHFKPTDIMSQSHSGVFPARPKRSSTASIMTQSNYENFSGDKPALRSRYVNSPRRRPWR